MIPRPPTVKPVSRMVRTRFNAQQTPQMIGTVTGALMPGMYW